MKWLRTIIGLGQSGSDTDLEFVREKFQIFRQLLSKHDHVLRLLSDMDEKAQGEYLFDLHYIKSSLKKMQADTYSAIELMVSMGGEKYNSLFKVTDNIFSDLEQIIPLSGEIIKDELVIPYDILGRDKIKSVGGKNAQLGEMKSRLGLPVPEGFAITAWAYKLFVNSNNLQERITECLENLNIRSSDDLISCGERMREMVMQCEVPDEISKAILESSINLQKSNSITRFAMRSSALGEDSIHSFAGQYASILNVTPDKIIQLPEATMPGTSPSMVYDGTSIYLYKHDYDSAASAKIYKLNLEMNAVISTYNLALESSPNRISWIDKMAFRNEVLWAFGGFGDPSGMGYIDGVFKIDISTSNSSSQLKFNSLALLGSLWIKV